MRFNEAVCNSVMSFHRGLHNNNQLQRSSSEILVNEKLNDTIADTRGFSIGRNTRSQYSSIELVRNNKNNEHNINNNLDYQSSSTESLADYEGIDLYYDDDPGQELTGSDWSIYSEDGNLPPGCRGIVNPNYPGFQHLGPSLLSDTDDTEDEQECEKEDEFNNNVDETVNRLDGQNDGQKEFYKKPKFIIQPTNPFYDCMNLVKNLQDPASGDCYGGEVEIVQLTTSVKETLQFPEIEDITDSCSKCNSETEEVEDIPVEGQIDLIREAQKLTESTKEMTDPVTEEDKDEKMEKDSKFLESDSKLDEIDLLSNINIKDNFEYRQQSVPDLVSMDADVIDRDKQLAQQDGANLKKEKMMKNQARRRQKSSKPNNDEFAEKQIQDNDLLGSFDVYNIETAMPKIDIDAIENHLRAAREEERRRRNDREEIRKRLAMGPEADDIRSERGKKPSLHSRLQSDSESAHGIEIDESRSKTLSLLDTSSSSSSSSSALSSSTCSLSNSPRAKSMSNYNKKSTISSAVRPQIISLPPLRLDTSGLAAPIDEADFFARQARLQIEARLALAQAKEMAHMQMEIERQKLQVNPITEMVRSSLLKIGVTLGEERRRLSRTLLTELNIAQLQVLANDLHARIATLNEALVEGLLLRDDLLMEQDSMLVDVEDLTRYLGAKQETACKKRQQKTSNNNTSNSTASSQRKNHQKRSSKSRTSSGCSNTIGSSSSLSSPAVLSNATSAKFSRGRNLVEIMKK